MEFILVGGFVIVGATFLLGVMVWNLINIAGPNEVLIISGTPRQIEGRTIGYSTVKGGRAIRLPLIETVNRMDLTNMTIEVAVTNAYSRGGIPLTVQAVANVKINGLEPVLNNAVERFLGYQRDEIMQVAKDTLEGNLRGVLSQLTPEQVNEDKTTFADKLLEEAEHDLKKLGLTLDTLKIQNVTDERGYLNSIGRKQSANLIKRSRVAEADAKAKSATNDAANKERARVSEIDSQMQILKAETDRRIQDTISRREALIAEEQGKVKAMIAKAEGELRVQAARVEQARRQLEADVVAPANAEMEQRMAEARGRASGIVENGRATAAALESMIASWERGGAASRDIFLMQKLNVTLAQMASTVQGAKIDTITMLPAGEAGGARRALTVMEEIQGATGMNVVGALEGLARGAQNAKKA